MKVLSIRGKNVQEGDQDLQTKIEEMEQEQETLKMRCKQLVEQVTRLIPSGLILCDDSVKKQNLLATKSRKSTPK